MWKRASLTEPSVFIGLPLIHNQNFKNKEQFLRHLPRKARYEIY